MNSPSPLAEWTLDMRDTLDGMGWHIKLGEEFISLHRVRKNGSPLKGSDVSLSYEQMAYDLVVDKDGEIHRENYRLRKRPWTVRAKNRQSKSYSNQDRAAEYFMEMASELAPIY
ncbi:MAG TPA: hypothetical protein VKA31_05975 [Mariprofundaceae bacterium]|nr:hypothetical protein [Mariprofundaceae bacterium]